MKLSDKFSIFSGYAFKDFNTSQQGVPIIKIGNITADGRLNVDDVQYSTQTPNRKFYAQKGDFLIALSGATTGKSTIYSLKDNQYLVNQRVGIIRPITNNVRTELFFKYYLQYISHLVLHRAHGSAQPNISPKDLANFLLPCIDEKEQVEIGKLLSNIEEGIRVKQEQLKALDELLQSRFTEMFGTLDMSKASDDWQSLGLLAKIHTGTTPSTTNADNWNGDILWITPAEIKSDSYYIYDTTRKITKQGQLSKSLTIMPRDTVLLSTRAPIGKVGIVGKPMACNQGFKNFECGKKLNPIFLYVLLKYNTTYLNSLGTGTTFKEISKSNVEKIKIPVPCVEKQNQFAEFVQQVERAKEIVKIQIKDLQELLALKMDEYFR